MPDSSPAIRIRSFLQIAPYLASRGVSPIEFFERLGISPNVFRNADGWLPRAVCFRIGNELASVTGDPFAGAHVGNAIDLRQLGDWGAAILAAPDVGHACALAAANISLLQQGTELRFAVGPRKAQILFRFQGACDYDPRQFIHGSLAVLRKVALLAGEPAAVCAQLSSPSGRGKEALEECLGPNIEMGRDWDMIEIDRDVLDRPLAGSGGRPGKAEEALETAVAAAGFVSRMLSEQRLTVELVAARLRLSTRTMQRRLKYCGIEFEELLDETRRSEAVRLLAEGEHSMTEIAYRLGYSDPAHFTRAFKRWKGVPPSRYA